MLYSSSMSLFLHAASTVLVIFVLTICAAAVALMVREAVLDKRTKAKVEKDVLSFIGYKKHAMHCDFCRCTGDNTGHSAYAKTEDGRWICDVCYLYDLCTEGNHNGPCADKNCPHRPKLATGWIIPYPKKGDAGRVSRMTRGGPTR